MAISGRVVVTRHVRTFTRPSSGSTVAATSGCTSRPQERRRRQVRVRPRRCRSAASRWCSGSYCTVAGDRAVRVRRQIRGSRLVPARGRRRCRTGDRTAAAAGSCIGRRHCVPVRIIAREALLRIRDHRLVLQEQVRPAGTTASRSALSPAAGGDRVDRDAVVPPAAPVPAEPVGDHESAAEPREQ